MSDRRQARIQDRISTEDWQAGGHLGDFLRDIYKAGHLAPEEFVAGMSLLDDMQQVHGTSGGLTARYGDQVDNVQPERLPPRFGSRPDAYQRMQTALDSLRPHERDLLSHLVRGRELQRGKLSDWGRVRSGYSRPDAQAAFAVGQIKSMLASLGEIYRSRVPRGKAAA